MRILKLQAENVKRLSVVEITPDPSGALVIVSGENASGKSSTIDAIAMAIGGAALCPEQPIRAGETKATIRVDLGDFIVTRTFLASGGTSLTVANRDGAKYPSPQAVLDGLVGKLSFDPLAFANMKVDAQAATLRAIAKIDTSDLDVDRKRAFDERTLVNRDVTTLTATSKTLPRHEGVGDALVDTAPILEQIAAIRAAQVKADMAAEKARDLSTDVRVVTRDLVDAKVAVTDLERRLAEARAKVAGLEMDMKEAVTRHDDAVAEAARLARAVPDRVALDAQLAEAAAMNRRITENQAHAAHLAKLAEATASADALTYRINQIDTEKAALLEQATFPIVGLGLSTEGTVTWQGVPFSQASMAERLRVSVAIAAALNRGLKVCLIRNGNDLDDTRLALLAEFAAAHGVQCWVERIAGGPAGQHVVVIEDGTVRG